MALEFDWDGDVIVTTEALRGFIVAALGGTQWPDGVIARDGLQVYAGQVSGDEVNPDTALFGFDQQFRATFRFANLAEPATTDHNIALMVHVLIAFAQSHGGQGVLLFNGEEAVLQYGEDGVVFAADWEDWTENGEVAALLPQFTVRLLPQPLL